MGQHRSAVGKFLSFEPRAYKVLDALDAVGALSVEGVKITHSVWSGTDFTDEGPAWQSYKDLAKEMLTKLQDAGHFTDRVQDAHFRTLFHEWQKPAYFVDFSPIEVSLEEMKRRQEAIYASEISF